LKRNPEVESLKLLCSIHFRLLIVLTVPFSSFDAHNLTYKTKYIKHNIIRAGPYEGNKRRIVLGFVYKPYH
jgi:hypothetical protein